MSNGRLERSPRSIERPSRLRARSAKITYVLLYFGVNLLFGRGLNQLKKQMGWDKLEPFMWIASIVLLAAAPLLAWLKPEKFSPGAVERRLSERQLRRSFAKYGFDLERYEEWRSRQ